VCRRSNAPPAFPPSLASDQSFGGIGFNDSTGRIGAARRTRLRADRAALWAASRHGFPGPIALMAAFRARGAYPAAVVFLHSSPVRHEDGSTITGLAIVGAID